MFGGKWMDTFVDKLSQRLTAHEMIKANAAADAAELQKTKEQVEQYDALLKEIREINTVNTEAARQVVSLATESLRKIEDTDRVNQLIDECLAKIAEIKAGTENMEALEQQLAELKSGIDVLYSEMAEHVHKENVKVYRNVQAVVVEEATKVNDANAAATKKLSRKVNAVLVVSIISLLATAAGLAFQILVYLNIL